MAGLEKYPGIKKTEINPLLDWYSFPYGNLIIILA
jgi:hypothetical protein